MAIPYRSGQYLGWAGLSTSGINTSQVNAAANYSAYSFIAAGSLTINEARVYISAVTGTLGASDILADLYDSTGSSGAPGSSIETGKTPSATITGAGWYDFTGFSTALTSGQQYWIVFRNVNGTPASNYCTFRAVAGLQFWQLGLSANRQMWARATSTNSGSTWSISGGSSSMLRIRYSTGYDGMPTYNLANAGSGDGVYSSRESGVVFTSPKLNLLRVCGLSMLVGSKTGSPTGSPRLRLWENQNSTPVVLATGTLPSTAISSTQLWVTAYFDSATIITMRPNTTYRITLGETTQSDASTNRFNNYEYSWDTDSNSTILLPWNGTCQKTYFDGSSWTDTAGSIFGHALLLDPAQEFYGSTHATYQLGVM